MAANTGYQIGLPGVDLATAYVTKNYVIDLYPNLSDKYRNSELYYWGLTNSLTNPPYLKIGSNTAIRPLSSDGSPLGLNWKQIDVNGIFNNSFGYDYYDFTMAAIKTDGTLWVLSSDSSVFGQGFVFSSGTSWKQVSVNSPQFLNKPSFAAIRTNGTLWGWGPDWIGGVSSPVQEISGSTDWKQVSFGSTHVLAVKANNTIWARGVQSYGELGLGDVTERSSFVQVGANTNWKQVSCGLHHTAAVKFDGTLWTWGRNDSGQLGQDLTWPPTNLARSSPVQTVIGGNDWKQVSCGFKNTSAIKEDGTLWVWGSNRFGQIGNNIQSITLGDGGAGDNVPYPYMVSTARNWRQVVSGFNLTTALKTDGTLWAWGFNPQKFNTSGANNDPVFTDRSSPTQIHNGSNNWKFIAGKNVTIVAIREESGDFDDYGI
jgi:alpha-tubulin suppressor-like RCC1 family protein